MCMERDLVPLYTFSAFYLVQKFVKSSCCTSKSLALRSNELSLRIPGYLQLIALFSHCNFGKGGKLKWAGLISTKWGPIRAFTESVPYSCLHIFESLLQC